MKRAILLVDHGSRHAEANALVQAARHGVLLDGSQIYVTASPCFNCFKLIANAGIRTVYYGELYRDERVLEFAHDAGIRLVHLGIEEGHGTSDAP